MLSPISTTPSTLPGSSQRHAAGADFTLDLFAQFEPEPREEPAPVRASSALPDLAHLASEQLAGRLPARVTTQAAMDEATSAQSPAPDRPASARRGRSSPGDEPASARTDPSGATPTARSTSNDPASSRTTESAPAPPPEPTSETRTSEPANAARTTIPPVLSAPTAAGDRGIVQGGPGAPSARTLLGRLGSMGERARASASPSRPATSAALRRETPEAFRAALTRGLAAALRSRTGEVTMRLEPRSLGVMKVKLEIEGARVRATLEASTTQARDLLSENLTALRSGLEARGLTADSIDVRLWQEAADTRQDSSVVGDDRHHAERQPTGRRGERPPDDRPEDHEPETPVVLGPIEEGRLDAIA